MKKRLNIFLLFFALFATVFSQQAEVEITGIVTDSLHEPLIGVSIAIKDKPGVGTVTNANGEYKIMATPYNVLIFSYVGFEKIEIPVQNQREIDVIMKEGDESVLSEVVVTGTGVQRKITVTGAITTVDIKTLRTPTSNITNALAGNVAGVISMQRSGEPGSNNSEFWIRGISTFGAGASALVLVDGFERNFNEVNIEDIESFSILKDASATAIYGSRGANGVIIITTKRGEAGKVNINTKGEYGYSTRTRTPQFVDGLTYAELVNEAKITRNQEPLYTPIELEIFQKNLDPDLYPNINWQDIVLKRGASIYRGTVNFSGGGSTARYFVSGSFINEGGMYKTDRELKEEYNTNANMKRTNYRINVDLDLTKTTLISVGVSGFLEKQNFPGGNYGIWNALIGQSPVSTPLLYSNGLVPAYGTGNRTNPWVQVTRSGYKEFWKNVVETNISVNQNLNFITEGLRFIGRFAYDIRNDNSINRVKWPEQYFTERRRDRNGNLIMKRISPESLLTQSTDSWGERRYVLETELHYEKLINKIHRIGGLLKYNMRDLSNTYNFGGDIIVGIPNRNLGLSGRATYNYKDRYMADFNFGYTGSENFPNGRKFGFFPAASVGWNIAEESFVKDNIKWLDMFKIRYSYGEVGNDNVGVRFPYLSTIGDMMAGEAYEGYYYGDPRNPNFYRGLHYQQVASSNLTWEIARKHNLGFDIHLLNNKFSTTIDIFNDRRENIFMQRQHLPDMVGVSSLPWANVGKMESKGFDGQFNYHEKLGDVSFTLRGNITYARNQVLEYDEMETAYQYTMTEGYRWQQAKGLIALGLFKDFEDIRNSAKQTFGEYLPGDIKYKDVNGDGFVNDEDRVAIGSTRIPNLIYGSGLAVLWKGFDFNVHFQGAGKSSYFINGFSVYPFIEGAWGNILTDVALPENRWISREISGNPATENIHAKYPRLSYGGNANNYRESTYWLRDGSYLRFKTLEIGYTIPQSVLNRLHIGTMRLYLVGNNLFVWDKLKLWDPELASGHGMNYPPSRTITLGFNLSF